jgi:DNA-binding GntR family transcriptional regulator
MPRGLLSKVNHTSVAEQAYDGIRESIVRGHFAPGQQLIEARLAEELGISRGPVREGLKRLGQDGLVVHRPHQGTFVREFTAGDLMSIYTIRVALETTAIRLVTREGTSPEPLVTLLDQMRSAADDRRLQDLATLGYTFHRTLCELSRNAFIVQFFDTISAQVQLALELDTMEYLHFSTPLDFVEAHSVLVGAIDAGDEYQAASLLESHIMLGIEEFLATFSTSDAASGSVPPAAPPAG